MSTAEGRFSLGKGLQWLWSMGLAIPLMMGGVLVILVAITLASDLYEAPTVANVGKLEEHRPLTPEFFEEENFWLVRLPDDEVVALYDRDPYTGCSLTWGVGHETLGRTGWFVDPCGGSAYDLSGACFDGPCEVGLNRLAVSIEPDGDIVVDPRDTTGGTHGQLRSENGEPINPPH
jgi:nitrite reductase/ring-hydroxylating ferredoxin subunit